MERKLLSIISANEGQAHQTVYNILTPTHNAFVERRMFSFFEPKGNKLPILLVAHADTVHRKGLALEVKNGIIRNRAGVLGADDRAGIAIILELVKKLPAKPYVLITSGEEQGGIGVTSFTSSGILDAFLPDINLFVEYDRKGVDELVTYTPAPASALNPWLNGGYKESIGSFSDVSVLTDDYKTAHVNLSAGYFNEHTSSEYCVVAGVEYAIARGLDILPTFVGKRHIAVPESYSYSKYYLRGSQRHYNSEPFHFSDIFDKDKSKEKEEEHFCHYCLVSSTKMTGDMYGGVWVCDPCFEKEPLTARCFWCGLEKDISEMVYFENCFICGACDNTILKE